jgi:hypothetical protein
LILFSQKEARKPMSILQRLLGRDGAQHRVQGAASFDSHRAFQDSLRLISASSWPEVQRIVEGNPQLLSDQGIVFLET